MKKIIPIVSLAIFLAACDSKTKDADKLAMPVADTTGLSEFQDWKAMNERADREQPEQATVEYAAPVKRRTYAPAPRAVEPAPAVEYPAPPVSTGERTSTTRDDAPDEGTVATTGNGTENTTGTGTEAEKTAEKTGISKSAKGAIIGGVGGAAAGAIINKKNRAAGAVIGAVIGAGGGYVLGRKMDKKDGRY